MFYKKNQEFTIAAREWLQSVFSSNKSSLKARVMLLRAIQKMTGWPRTIRAARYLKKR